MEPSAKEEKTQKGPARYADEDSVAVAQSGRKEKEAYKPQTMCQPEVANPGEAGEPKLQTSGHQVAEVVQEWLIAPASGMSQQIQLTSAKVR